MELRQVRETVVPYGQAALWWLGQMGFLIKLGNHLLCIDYFASLDPNRLIEPPVPAAQLTGVDLFLGTHDHGDHIDRPAWRVWKDTCPQARFLTPAAHVPSLMEEGMPFERLVGLNAGGEYEWNQITIRALPSAHEFFDRDPATGLYPHLQYLIEGNGVRIFHTGDTLVYDGMTPRLQEWKPDILIVPINGRDGVRYRSGCIGNMTFQEAADLAGHVGPKIVIPTHWDMFADNLGQPELFADLLDAKFPGKVECRIPERGACMRYQKKEAQR